MAFMAVTIVVFLVLGCLLEGLPAVLLLAPIMFPIAKKLGINDVHYSMVVVCAMNVGLMMPPIGVGFYVACRIGDAKPDEVMGAIWPYLVALLVGVVVIAAVPGISTVALCSARSAHALIDQVSVPVQGCGARSADRRRWHRSRRPPPAPGR